MTERILSAVREADAYNAVLDYADELGYADLWVDEVEGKFYAMSTPFELAQQREDVRSMLLDEFPDLEGDVIAHIMDVALYYLMFPFERMI